MRALAVVLAGSLAGCAVNSYRIPSSELARLAQTPPEARGQHVRVVQEIVQSDVPPAPPVTGQTEVVIAPQIDVSAGINPRPRHDSGGWGSIGPGGKIGGAGSDGKAAAIALIAVAATAMVTAAVIEG